MPGPTKPKLLLALGMLSIMLAPGAAAQVPPDVQFVRAMIMHHAQAVEMAAMVRARTASLTLRTLAERIDLSQREEIQRMRTWLGARGDSATSMEHEHAGHAAAAMTMPGMLAPVQLDSLRALRGRAFDRRFVRYMIGHHEGALTMVARLLGTPGAVRDPMLFQLANSIDADQRAEIARMRAMFSTPAPKEK